MSKRKKRPQRRVVAPSAPVAPRDVLEELGQVVEDLDGLASERRRLEERLGALVNRGRVEGRTWTEMGRVLGVTPQAVQKRYSSKS